MARLFVRHIDSSMERSGRPAAFLAGAVLLAAVMYFALLYLASR